MIIKNIITVTLLLFTISIGASPIDVLEFNDPAQEKRYFNLSEELRCLKCQNSSIAGSNAELARDLRHKVYDMIVNKNMSNTQIKEWMLARYGDFVLYKPPLKTHTYILWGFPLILAVLALIMLYFKLRAKGTQKTSEITTHQRKIIDELKS